jgi:hypothetical protein
MFTARHLHQIARYPGRNIMEPSQSYPAGDSSSVHVSEFEFPIDETSPKYQQFVGRLETSLAAMVDRWLHVSAPCAARGNLRPHAKD